MLMPGLNSLTQTGLLKSERFMYWCGFPLCLQSSPQDSTPSPKTSYMDTWPAAAPHRRPPQTNGHDRPPNHSGSATFSTPQRKDMVLPVVFMSFFFKQTMKKHLLLKLEAWFRIKQKKTNTKIKKNIIIIEQPKRASCLCMSMSDCSRMACL